MMGRIGHKISHTFCIKLYLGSIELAPWAFLIGYSALKYQLLSIQYCLIKYDDKSELMVIFWVLT